MPTKGYVFKDGGPIPDDDLSEPRSQALGPIQHDPRESSSRASTSNSNNNSNPVINTPSASSADSNDIEHPSDSHAFAMAEPDTVGAIQTNHEEGEVRDMGWREHPENVPKELVGGMQNEELWTLVRRFNKQMYHVKATNDPLLGRLDLNIADEDEFSPDKLRSNVERLYMTVIIGLIAFGKHVARLRSWREPRRTTAFCVSYALAWIFNFLTPLIFTTLIVLIVFPPARSLMFPPAPIALVSSKSGGVQSPPAGVLGSHDSATGAPEKHQGEAVEQEAHNFVTGIGTIALSSAAGKHEQADPDKSPVDDAVPDPTNIATVGAESQTTAAGGTANAAHDKTKQPMEEAMWTKMRPFMHTIGDVADGWERIGNALSPTPPFPRDLPRFRLAAVITPLLAVSLVTTSAVFTKMMTGIIGFAFFSDPLLWRGLEILNEKVPNWQKYLELRNSILKGVPTNAQLTITLLRLGEANKAPIPPPPSSDQPPASKPASINGDELPLDTTHEELQEAIHKSDDDTNNDGSDPSSTSDPNAKPAKKGSAIVGFFKGTTNTGVQAKLNIDKARAAVGSKSAKNYLGILPNPAEPNVSGPIDFKARYKGVKGWIYISTYATDIPTVSFSKESSDGTGKEPEKASAKFSIPIQDIKELKKVGGLGWKGKLVVGWATGRPVADGLEIVDKKGETYRLTAIRLREELFNRLVAMGGQKWESW